MRLRLVASVVGLAGLAACGSASPSAAHQQHAKLAAASGRTAAGNRAATKAEALRLLGLAPLPDGAQPSRLRSKELSGPALGVPGTSSLVDKHRFYLVAEAYQQVFTYVKHHRPEGLTLAGESSGGGPGGTSSEGIAWSEPDTKYAQELGVSVGVAPMDHGSKTLLRVDGYGEWLDPRPVRDTSTGQRYHVDLADGCPTTIDPQADVRNQGSDLKQRLLPREKPTAALICEYDGANRKPHFGLGRSATLGAEDARKLAARFAALPIPHTDGGFGSCPMDDGTGNLVVFAYGGRQDVDLLAKANGCENVRNGDIVVAGGVSYRPWARPLPI